MHISIKTLTLMISLLLLAGCASVTKQASQTDQIISPRITFAPLIELNYQEVANNIDQNIGAEVRWGGQVVLAEQSETTVRLTIFAYPLSPNGQPEYPLGEVKNQRFVVDVDKSLLADKDPDDQLLANDFVTFYGKVAQNLVVKNGSKQITIPLINAIEFVNWDSPEQQQYAADRRGNAFYSLGARKGHFGNRYYRKGSYFDRSYYGRSYYGHSRFGHHRFGFSRSRFGHGRFHGLHHSKRGFGHFSKSRHGRRFKRH